MIGDVLTLTALGLITLVALLAALVLKRLATKLGLDITEKHEQTVRQIVHDAIVRTEEVAKRDPTMTSTDKADYTERTIAEQAQATGRRIDPSTARHMVDVMLPIVRSRGIGVTPKPPIIPVAPVVTAPAASPRRASH